MSGDWIKMRMDLRNHPKVVRMSSALKADRLRVVGGLWAVWCTFDAHSPDGLLEGYTLQAIDDDLGWRGFGAAMQAVGWLVESESGLEMPRFDEHNGKSAKRRAQESERKRNERNADERPQPVRELSASHADKKQTACVLEKEKKEIPPKGPPLVLPDWLPIEPWDAFVAMRKAKGRRAPFTDEARAGIIRELGKLHEAGHDVSVVLNASVVNGWSGVFPPKRVVVGDGAAERAEMFRKGQR